MIKACILGSIFMIAPYVLPADQSFAAALTADPLLPFRIGLAVGIGVLAAGVFR